MRADHLWLRAAKAQLQTSLEIVGGFDVGFDSKIPEQTKDALMKFVYWVEDHFCLPITLWVDFKYNHYLRSNDGGRVGYRFYWVDFVSYPIFENPDDIPVIELPVRMEHQSLEDVLTLFIEAISHYFIWLMNDPVRGCTVTAEEVEEVLQAYLRGCSN